LNKVTIQDCDKAFKNGEKALKTSFFTFKFSPDYLSASINFVEAGKGFYELKQFDSSLNAYIRAIECHKKTNDSWEEANCCEQIARIFLFEKDDFANGSKYLKQASYLYQVAGKGIVAPRLYLETSNKLAEKNKIKYAIYLLQEAFNECSELGYDDLMRVMLEDIHTKLLNLYCLNEQFNLAIDITEKLTKIQIDSKKEKKNKITKNLSRICILRMICNEEYLCEGIIERMYSVYDSSCGDDIEDIKNLVDYFISDCFYWAIYISNIHRKNVHPTSLVCNGLHTRIRPQFPLLLHTCH